MSKPDKRTITKSTELGNGETDLSICRIVHFSGTSNGSGTVTCVRIYLTEYNLAALSLIILYTVCLFPFPVQD